MQPVKSIQPITQSILDAVDQAIKDGKYKVQIELKSRPEEQDLLVLESWKSDMEHIHKWKITDNSSVDIHTFIVSWEPDESENETTPEAIRSLAGEVAHGLGEIACEMIDISSKVTDVALAITAK
jgi:hypothetical protein